MVYILFGPNLTSLNFLIELVFDFMYANYVWTHPCKIKILKICHCYQPSQKEEKTNTGKMSTACKSDFFFWKREKQSMQWVEEQENAANKSQKKNMQCAEE